MLFHGRLNVKTLVDKEANADQIGKTLEEMAKQAGPEDTFVLFMAGHGIPSMRNITSCHGSCNMKTTIHCESMRSARLNSGIGWPCFQLVRSSCWIRVAREAS